MQFLTVVGSGLSCAALAGAAASHVCERYVRWFHVNQRGGTAAYFVFAVVLLGAAAGLVVGLLSGFLAPTLAAALAVDAAAVLAISGPVAAVLYVRGDVPPRDRGESLDLAIEVRAPQGMRLTNAMRALGGYATLRRVRPDGKDGYATYNSGPWRNGDGDKGRWTVFLTLGVFSAKGPWRVEFQPDDKVRVRFPDLHPGPMRAAAEWSSWIASPEGYEFRYRTVVSSESRRLQAEAAAAVRASEAASRQMPERKSPVEDWVRFLGSPECTGDRQLEALGIIRSRHEEVIRLLEGARPGALEVPLRAVSVYYQMPASFEEPLRGLLRPLTEAVSEHCRQSPAEDPDILAARALRESFTRWASAWDVLLTCHPDAAPPDFTPLVEASAKAGENDPVREIGRSALSYRDNALRKW